MMLVDAVHIFKKRFGSENSEVVSITQGYTLLLIYFQRVIVHVTIMPLKAQTPMTLLILIILKFCK